MRRALVLGICIAVLGAGAGTWLVYASKMSSGSVTPTSAAATAHRAEAGSGGAVSALSKADAFNESGVEGVPLAAALRSMGHPVNLLSAKDAGSVVKVLVGEWGMAVRYESGITLSVGPRRDLGPEFNQVAALEANGSAVFSDGERHQHAEEPPDAKLAAAPSIQAFSIAGGTQLLSGNRTWHVKTQLLWNDANFTYHLYSRDDDVSLDQLRLFMRNSCPAS